MAESENLDARPGRTVKPLGDPVDWSAEDVARLAEVTDADKVDARAYWKDRAPASQPDQGGETVDARHLIDARKPKGRRDA